MKLTMRSEYSLLALIYIARHGDEDYVRVDDVCAYYEIPKRYLENLLMALKSSGYLKAKRGVAGGYRLARAASAITVGEVIRLMDGALAPTESVSVYFYAETPLEKEAKAIELLRNIRDYIAELLEKTTLADLL